MRNCFIIMFKILGNGFNKGSKTAKRSLLLFLTMSLPLLVKAYDFNVDGIYYTITSTTDHTVEVASGDVNYSGNIVIPDHVTYNGVKFLVNGIQKGKCVGSYGGYTSLKFEGGAFTSSNISSVTIPETITEIRDGVFAHCWNLQTISFPSSLTKITGRGAFYGTASLTELILPNSLTEVGMEAFWGSGIKSLTIGSNIQKMDYCSFRDCSKLTTINIPSIAAWCQITFVNGNVTTHPLEFAKVLTLNGEKVTDIVIDSSINKIGDYAFYGYEELKSVRFEKGITSIGDYSFQGCTGIEILEFPDGLASIGHNSFEGCTSIKRIKFSGTISRIDYSAFANCNNIEVIESSIMKPTETSAFTNSTYMFTPLYVPTGTGNLYKETSGWRNFSSITEKEELGYYKFKLTYMVDNVEYKSYIMDYGATITPEPAPTKEGYTFSGWSEIPNTMPDHDVIITGTFTKNATEKCASPTISYENGELKMTCATEGVSYITEIAVADARKYYDTSIQLSATYNISVYAKKEGYNNSETVTATLCWIDQQPKTEGISNGIVNVRATAILIQSNGGQLTIKGANDGDIIGVYSINGTKIGASVSKSGVAHIETNIQSGNVVIVKINNRSIKVVIK